MTFLKKTKKKEMIPFQRDTEEKNKKSLNLEDQTFFMKWIETNQGILYGLLWATGIAAWGLVAYIAISKTWLAVSAWCERIFDNFF